MQARTAVVMAVLLGATSACDSFYGIHGRVKSCADAKPIADASVRVFLSENDDRERKSSPDGSFTVVLNHPATAETSTMTVTAEGFTRVEREVQPSPQGEDVCLDPAP